MARTRDTKRVERLLQLTQEKRKLLREEIESGSSLQAEYDGEGAEEQKYIARLKELREHNARVEAEAKRLGFKSNADREQHEEKAAAEAKAKADAEAKAKADEEAKAAEAKAKADAEAKAAEEAAAKGAANQPK